jgi:asparagine synthase (glutamine-hydrolysing)
MCGIAGFTNFKGLYKAHEGQWNHILTDMRESMKRRGPDEQGSYLCENTGMCQARLSIRDIAHGKQPMSRIVGGHEFVLVYNGEIYNTDELQRDLKEKGWQFHTTSDTEVILVGLIQYGPDFVKQLNGIFAFAFWDKDKNAMYLFRDRAGVKPIFYWVYDDTLVFGSEPKALFCYPGVTPVLDRQGLCEVFGIGPARTNGIGVFKNMYEVKPAAFVSFTPKGLKEQFYWQLESKLHTDSEETTVAKLGYLVNDAVERQMVSDVPVCSFLSGGVDSSIVTAIANKKLMKETGKPLNTFSFDFKDNDKYFKASSFQSSQDRPYVDEMVAFLGTNHTYLECDTEELADYLYKAVDAKDLPGMADVDSSLLYFCEKVKEQNKVTLTGECADEIFGGYPWFHRKDMFEKDMFPWSSDMSIRELLLTDEMKEKLNIGEYAKMRYDESIAQVPVLEGETGDEKRRRELSFLNLKWFMCTLLDRMDRTSMYSGLEARVPYADHRIMEYVFNVPWSIKCKDGQAKYLLRKSAEGLLPDDVLWRRKSPYPKTYHPGYEALLKQRLLAVIADRHSPLLQIIDADKVRNFMHSSFDYGKPFFGQLMAGPQLLAYLLEINYWLDKYNISIEL